MGILLWKDGLHVETAPWMPVADTYPRADCRFVRSQWETSLQSNAVSHWLCTNLQSALIHILSDPTSMVSTDGHDWQSGGLADSLTRALCIIDLALIPRAHPPLYTAQHRATTAARVYTLCTQIPGGNWTRTSRTLSNFMKDWHINIPMTDRLGQVKHLVSSLAMEIPILVLGHQYGLHRIKEHEFQTITLGARLIFPLIP